MLTKQEQRAIIVIILFIIALFFPVYLRWWDLSSVLSYVPYFLLGGIVGTLLLGFRERIEKFFGKKPEPTLEQKTSYVMEPDVDRNFAHLTIHFVKIKSEPDIPSLTRTRCVTYDSRRQYYRVPDYLEPYVKAHKIGWHVHDNKDKLDKYLEQFDRYPTDPPIEILSLKYNEYGHLVLAKDEYSELISKLGNRRLEDLQVVLLRRISLGRYVHRTLLLKNSTKEAWQSPPCDSVLLANRKITSEEYTMRPWEDCKAWCKRLGYTYIPQRYPESKLTERT
jgi:hypothetical protein